MKSELWSIKSSANLQLNLSAWLLQLPEPRQGDYVMECLLAGVAALATALLDEGFALELGSQASQRPRVLCTWRAPAVRRCPPGSAPSRAHVPWCRRRRTCRGSAAPAWPPSHGARDTHALTGHAFRAGSNPAPRPGPVSSETWSQARKVGPLIQLQKIIRCPS